MPAGAVLAGDHQDMRKTQNLLWVTFTVVVSFFVGVLVARVFPSGFLPSGTGEWGSIAEWTAAAAAVFTALVAWKALESWQAQLRGGTQHSVAHEIATSAVALKYAFYEARRFPISIVEYPRDWAARAGRLHTDVEKAADHKHAYDGRIKELWPYVIDLRTLRAKAWATLGVEIAEAMELLLRRVSELHGYMAMHVSQLETGTVDPEGWPEQLITLYKAAVAAHFDKSDAFSLQFEENLAALMALLRPYMGKDS